MTKNEFLVMFFEGSQIFGGVFDGSLVKGPGLFILVDAIYLSLETHDIYDTPDMGTLNGTDSVSQSVSDTPGTRDATHLKRCPLMSFSP